VICIHNHLSFHFWWAPLLAQRTIIIHVVLDISFRFGNLLVRNLIIDLKSVSFWVFGRLSVSKLLLWKPRMLVIHKLGRILKRLDLLAKQLLFKIMLGESGWLHFIKCFLVSLVH